MPESTDSKTRNEKPKQFYFARPWECEHRNGYSDIIVYIEASGNWERIATINTTAGVSAEAMAQFICGLVNDSQKNQNLLQDAMKTLESVLEEGLDYSAAEDVDKVVADIKKVVS